MHRYVKDRENQYSILCCATKLKQTLSHIYMHMQQLIFLVKGDRCSKVYLYVMNEFNMSRSFSGVNSPRKLASMSFLICNNISHPKIQQQIQINTISDKECTRYFAIRREFCMGNTQKDYKFNNKWIRILFKKKQTVRSSFFMGGRPIPHALAILCPTGTPTSSLPLQVSYLNHSLRQYLS